MSDVVAASLQGIPPSQICQTFFGLSSALIGLIQAMPADLRGTLMDYGARRPQDGISGEISQKADGQKDNGSLTGAIRVLKGMLAKVTNYSQVPHSWFLHYYILTTSWSAFWAWQFLSKGSVMRALATMQQEQQRKNGQPSMEMGQVVLAWALMALQGSRRLYESIYVSKPGKTPMWVVHWVMGLLYYTAMGISIWIEGSDAILKQWQAPQPFKVLTPKTSAAAALFFFAWYNQNKCHRYLASLKKYTLPEEGSFRNLVCPHYTYECLLYVALSMATAPPGKLFNKTLLSGLLFVGVNLGATARGTKKWYEEKFGEDKVAKKWQMIPFLF